MSLTLLKKILFISIAYAICSACGAESTPPVETPPATVAPSNPDDSSNTSGNDSPTTPDNPSDETPDGTDPDNSGENGNGGDGNGETTEPEPEPEPQDPSDPDSNATITLVGGTITDCAPEFLINGDKAAYAGYAGSSNGAYFIWKNKWTSADANLRIETWDLFGGMTSPGTRTIEAADTNYSDCGVCIFAEVADAGEFWITEGSTVTFTSLKTGSAGVGERMAGTISGSMTNGQCTGTVEIEFGGDARPIANGPL